MMESCLEGNALDKLAAALNFKVDGNSQDLWRLRSLKKGADKWLNVELELPAVHLRPSVFSTRASLLYNVRNAKSFRIPLACRSLSATKWLAVENPFYGLSIEEALVKADLEGRPNGQFA